MKQRYADAIIRGVTAKDFPIELFGKNALYRDPGIHPSNHFSFLNLAWNIRQTGEIFARRP